MPVSAIQLCQPRQPDPLADLTDDQRRRIGQRLALLQAWRMMCRDFAAAGEPKAAATSAFLLAHPDCARPTLYRWAAACETDGPRGLLDGRSSGDRPAAETVAEAPWQYFLSLYLTIQRRTVALCHLMVTERFGGEAAASAGWPGLRAIQRRVRRDLPAVHADYFRLGETEWWRLYRPKLRRDYSQYRAGEWIVGDFKRMDIFCRRSAADETIVRPLLSAFTDLRSRLVYGWHLTERENQDAVLIAFRNGVERWGPPRHAVIDNGKPYRATGISGGRPKFKRLIDDEDYVRSVFGGLNVAVHFAIPYNPDSKPIERWFRTLDLQFAATYASYCGGDQDDRFRAAHKLALEQPELCPTLADLREALGRWIEAYHATPHMGEGMEGLSPAAAFARFDPIPRAIVPAGSLDVLLMRSSKPVKVTEYGVRYNGIEYGQNDPRLFELQGRKVTLRIHPDDASYVIVCDLAGKPICRAANNALARTGVTQDDVATGIKSQNRARKLVSQMYAGQAKAAHQSVTEAAISARLAAGRRHAEQLAATGTDDAQPRNATPLRSDFTEAMTKYQRGLTVSPPAHSEDTLLDFGDLIDGESALPEEPDEEEPLNIEDLA